jgi:hypothetical protein
MITRLKLSTIEQGLPKYRSMLAGNAAYVPSSYESIATLTAAGGETSLSFTSIPATYQHLQIRGIYKDSYATASYGEMWVRFNNDSGTNYSYHDLLGNGATVSAAGNSTQGQMILQASSVNGVASTFGVVLMDIHDYASTSKYKTLRSMQGADRNSTATNPSAVCLTSGLWQSTTAVNRVDLIRGTTSFAAGSTFALYGIRG